jgi:hypothetical protein
MAIELNHLNTHLYVFDALNYHNVNSIELNLKLTNLQVDSTKRNKASNLVEKTEFVKVRVDEEAKEGAHLINLDLKVGNKVHHTTKLLPTEEIDDTNLTLKLEQ